MKKFIVVMAVCLLFAGCSKKEEVDEPMMGIANPMVGYDNIDQLNEKVGGNIKRIENAENEQFFVISNTVEEYNFTVDGLEYTIRFTKDKENDISGYYINGKTAFEGVTENWAVNGDAESKLCRVLTDEGQYVIYICDNGALEEESFNEICSTIIDSFNK